MSNKNKGLYNKFIVTRKDGSSQPGGKHENCEYFVLDLDHDKFAADALAAYSMACASEYPRLAEDLMAKADLIGRCDCVCECGHHKSSHVNGGFCNGLATEDDYKRYGLRACYCGGFVPKQKGGE